MKLVIIMLFTCLMQVSASSLAQKITLSEKNGQLEQVLNKISLQANLKVVYADDALDRANRINLQFNDLSLESALEQVFRNQPLTYEIKDKTLIIKPKEPTFLERLADRWAAIDVRGKVVDSETGEGLPGATVKVKGIAWSASTDVTGNFFLQDVNEDAVLEISYIGYVKQEVKARKDIGVIRLELSDSKLEEVQINAGYYTTTDKLRTGSIAKVAAKDIERQPVTSPLMSLQGRMAGVDIVASSGAPGSATKIRIRGQNSLRADGNYPLYVVDGMPVDSRPVLSAADGIIGDAGYDPLSSINPSNIESIEVLKDADATAIYGSRGANGVILVTTKKGNKMTGTNLEVNGYRGAGNITQHMKLLNTQQYLEMRKEAFRNDGVEPQSYDFDLAVWDTTRYTDWQKELAGRTANITNLQTTITGSNANTSFRLGGGYHMETLVFQGDFNYRRATGNFSLNHQSTNQRFQGTLSLNYGSERHKLYDDFSSLYLSILSLPPNAPAIYDSEGNLNWENNTYGNPLASTRNTHLNNSDNLIANSTLSYKILNTLTAKVSLGYTDLNGTEDIRYPISAYNPNYAMYVRGATKDASNKRKSWIIEPQLTFSRGFSFGEINVITGATMQENRYLSEMTGRGGYTSDVLLGNPQAAGSIAIERNDKTKYTYASVFARIGYNFKDKYLVNVTGRRDGSSRFGPGKRSANFGAVGAAWVFSNEDFVKNNLGLVSFGKLRASYGLTGNDQIGDGKFYNTYSLVGTGYQDAASLSPTALFNPDYRWELTNKLEAALEIGLFNNRISAEIAWYRNRSSNQLLETTLPYTTGFPSILANFGATVQNTGFEILLRTENLRSKHFRWSSSVNFTAPKNKLVAFPGLASSPYSSQFMIGQPISIYRLSIFNGVNPTTGEYEFVDADGDGTSSGDNDLTFIYNSSPKYYAGLANTLSWKAFELNFLFQFTKKNMQDAFFNAPGAAFNQPVEVLNRWQKEGDITNIQRFTQNVYGPVANNVSMYGRSSGSVVDGSFIRLKTLSFSYTLPEKLLGKANVDHASVFLQGQNLLTITKYKGPDPETGTSQPPLRMFTLGLQFKF